LENKISFTDIPEIIKKTMESHTVVHAPTLDDILEADQWARKEAMERVNALTNESIVNKTG
jgi:1-deoxy-D-xylulose-5-phosphate reductoisomerase